MKGVVTDTPQDCYMRMCWLKLGLVIKVETGWVTEFMIS